MKKTYLLIIALLAIIVLGFVVVVSLASGVLGVEEESVEVEVSIEDDIRVNYIAYNLSPGVLSLNEELEGSIYYEEEAIYKLNEAYNKETEVFVKVGDFLEKDQKIIKNKNKEVKALSKGRVLEINKNEDSVEIVILDYEKTYIYIEVQSEHQNILNKSLNITGNYMDIEEILTINRIDPFLENEKVKIYLKNPFIGFLNTKIKVVLNFGEIENLIIVEKEFVKFDAKGNAYVKIVEDNMFKDHMVTIVAENQESYGIVNDIYLNNKEVFVNKEELKLNEKNQ